MAGRVRDDEFAFWRGKVTVGNVNGDALFALGPQSICNSRKVDCSLARFGGSRRIF